jgi:hypothetical protein
MLEYFHDAWTLSRLRAPMALDGVLKLFGMVAA